MKKLSVKNIKITLPAFLLFAITASAQKLPNKQDESLLAPGNIKIDGRAAEWGGQFAAFNKSTQIFYTVSNSADNIFLTVQVTDPEMIKKIMANGLTFTVNGSTKKNDKQHVAVTFPCFKKMDDYQSIYRNLAYNPAYFYTDPIAIKKISDSLFYAINDQILTQSNEFTVAGISMATDTLIPIDNKTGIKAIGLFENKSTYTFEVAIPVKYLDGHIEKLSYNIKINGAAANKNGERRLVVVSRGIVEVKVADVPAFEQQIAMNNARAQSMMPVTDDPIDFWGEYTLAKKHVAN